MRKEITVTFFILCSSGVKKYNTSGDIPGNLCALCEGDCSTDSQKNKYVGYHGSFKCMADGKGDVSFAKHTTTEEVVDIGGYGNVNDYQYLCKDGSRKGNLREWITAFHDASDRFKAFEKIKIYSSRCTSRCNIKTLLKPSVYMEEYKYDIRRGNESLMYIWVSFIRRTATSALIN